MKKTQAFIQGKAKDSKAFISLVTTWEPEALAV